MSLSKYIFLNGFSDSPYRLNVELSGLMAQVTIPIEDKKLLALAKKNGSLVGATSDGSGMIFSARSSGFSSVLAAVAAAFVSKSPAQLQAYLQKDPTAQIEWEKMPNVACSSGQLLQSDVFSPRVFSPSPGKKTISLTISGSGGAAIEVVDRINNAKGLGLEFRAVDAANVDAEMRATLVSLLQYTVDGKIIYQITAPSAGTISPFGRYVALFLAIVAPIVNCYAQNRSTQSSLQASWMVPGAAAAVASPPKKRRRKAKPKKRVYKPRKSSKYRCKSVGRPPRKKNKRCKRIR